MATHKPIPSFTPKQIASFWSKVDMVDDDACWPWTAKIMPRGYGRVSFCDTYYLAHRVAYALVKGQIGEGLTLDHLCRNHACCNPAHLEAVPHKENVFRGTSPTATNAMKTRCHYGHEYTAENTRVNRWNRRKCLQCYAENLQRRKRERLANAKSADGDK